MKITRFAVAGTLESSDLLVEISPAEKGIEIRLESPVYKQFGNRIKQIITEVVEQFGVEGASIHAVDRGALDCTMQARGETAILRAKGAEK